MLMDKVDVGKSCQVRVGRKKYDGRVVARGKYIQTVAWYDDTIINNHIRNERRLIAEEKYLLGL